MARADPALQDLVRDTYMDANVHAAAERFLASAEFEETLTRVRHYVDPVVAVDLGAGNGVAAFSLVERGIPDVIAIEPDPSNEIGAGAIRQLLGDRCVVLECTGEDMPLPDSSIDLVYARQVLHHARDLPAMLVECGRVLRDGGLFFAAREHVVEGGAAQKQQFLENHPVHQHTAGENAYSLDEYLHAIEAAGLRVREVLGPWDSAINAFPAVRTQSDFLDWPRVRMAARWGRVGRAAGAVPLMRAVMFRRIKRTRWPGCPFTFLATR